MKPIHSIIVLVIMLVMGACSRDKGRAVSPQVTPEEIEEKKIPLKKEKDTEEEQYDIGTIGEFTPEIFVRLTILYKKESTRWLEEAALLSDAEQHRYFEESNRSFFEYFGITEEDYIRYSTDHIDELNKYLEEHPELTPPLQGE
ncbi:MAG TPA: hypothetical protein VMZ05_03410 [Spirochaetota bacterium]|nr:hypothetical protein [Spirochaetota bacterium]